jgi:NADPH-dependent F420 reductase
MKIGMLGTGRVGGTLGRRFAKLGHEVIFGTRDPKGVALALIASAGGRTRVVSLRDAAAQSDVVVLATPWESARSVLESVGSLQGKILVDCTNPVKADLKGLSLGFTTSAAEQVASWQPGARVVKAFNTTGSGNMENPQYKGGALSMFVCGDDAEAKKVVSELARGLGFEVVDSGALSSARYLEPLAMLWMHLAYAGKLGMDFGFRLVRR